MWLVCCVQWSDKPHGRKVRGENHQQDLGQIGVLDRMKLTIPSMLLRTLFAQNQEKDSMERLLQLVLQSSYSCMHFTTAITWYA